MGKLKTLTQAKAQQFYWIALIVFSLLLEASALFYQYVLDYLPCVLCIHVRVYLLALILVAILALFINKKLWGRLLANLLSLVIFIGLAERSYQLLGTERGFVFSECNMELGMPSWLALDQWWPLVFEVHTSCGYTPELLFGITMAEALMLMSVVLVLISTVFVLRLIFDLYCDHRKAHV